MKAIIMAAGKGTRINDTEHPMPKVLREVCGRPILSYALDAVQSIEREDITIIVGYLHEMVEKCFADCGCNFVLQGSDGYGTGYAVMCALDSEYLKDYEGDVVILNGDTPTTKRSTIEHMISVHERGGNACTLLSLNDPSNRSYGKIIRVGGEVKDIVEVKDCNEEQLKITEVNAGLYVFNAKKLRKALKSITCNNKANEYYLTDAPKILISDGERVEAVVTDDRTESFGVNTFAELEEVEAIVRSRQ